MATTPKSLRLEPGDVQLIERLVISTGIQSFSDLVRFALRELAKARGLETAAQQLHRPEAP